MVWHFYGELFYGGTLLPQNGQRTHDLKRNAQKAEMAAPINSMFAGSLSYCQDNVRPGSY